MNKRRELVLALSGIAVLPRWAGAQLPGALRIGWLSADRAANSPFFEAFRGGMRELGYVEGRNLIIEARFAEGSDERLDRYAKELVGLMPQVIVTQGGPATHPVQRAGASTPVVFGYSGDPVEGKVVASYAHPGGNFTGVSFLSLELAGKRMGLLKEVLPGLKRIAILARPEHPGEQKELHASRTAAQALGLAIDYFQVRNETELDDALASSVLKARSEAIVAFPDAFMMRFSERIAEFASSNRIPAMSGWAQFAERGNLLSYGPNLRAVFRRLAVYVDKIAKGAKPADLPVELPLTVELVVNLKAAKALGIKIPQSILVRADKVIE